MLEQILWSSWFSIFLRWGKCIISCWKCVWNIAFVYASIYLLLLLFFFCYFLVFRVPVLVLLKLFYRFQSNINPCWICMCVMPMRTDWRHSFCSTSFVFRLSYQEKIRTEKLSSNAQSSDIQWYILHNLNKLDRGVVWKANDECIAIPCHQQNVWINIGDFHALASTATVR